MKPLSPMQELIAAHINAKGEFERLFELNDWELADDAAVSAALDVTDDAFVAICAARPTTPGDDELRRLYLGDHLVAKINGCADLTEQVINALIGKGGAS